MPASKRGARRQLRKRKRRKGFRAVTAHQRHRSRRGRRYKVALRARNAGLQRRLDNAIAALERVSGEKHRLPRARKSADAALAWEATARARVEAE
jgi:hypothetical protein